MKCFQHQNSDAIGICANCGKGCCPNCVISSEPVISCSADCKQSIEENRQILERTKIMYGIGQHQRKHTISTQVILFTVMGLLFVGFGGYQIHKRSFEVGFFPLTMGGIFILVAVLAWYRNRKIKLNC